MEWSDWDKNLNWMPHNPCILNGVEHVVYCSKGGEIKNGKSDLTIAYSNDFLSKEALSDFFNNYYKELVNSLGKADFFKISSPDSPRVFAREALWFGNIAAIHWDFRVALDSANGNPEEADSYIHYHRCLKDWETENGWRERKSAVLSVLPDA